MSRRSDLRKRIDQVSFTVNDLTLYLDTHPTDEKALDLFNENIQTRLHLLQEYESQFEPLTVDCVNINAKSAQDEYCDYTKHPHFHWLDGPMPWEGGHL